MPRRKPQKGKRVNGTKRKVTKANGTAHKKVTKSNGTALKKRGKGSGAWTPQRRGSPEAWMKKLGYTPAALRCRILADMTEEEIVAIELEYGVPVIRPTRSERAKARRAAAARPVLSVAHETT